MAFDPYLSGYYDVGSQLSQYLKNKAATFFAKEEEAKKNLTSALDAERHRDFLRERFADAVGGLNIAKTPLRDVCTGIVDKEDYVIRKIVFQSQPGFYVTSNLYVPNNLPGKAPAVLFACGHHETAKSAAEYQKVCIDLATNGFVVLIVDPIGQGERMQYYDRSAERPLVNWGVTEHTYAALQCNLTGSSVARYFIWDLIRSVDYLCSLPEVDANRIGMTGNSGGGMQTCYMMLADDRIQAAVPCTWVTSREAYMQTGQSQDGEQIIYGAIGGGLNYDDFISCFAPKPAMIGAVESDFFCIEGTVRSYERAKRVYDLYGCGDRVSLCVTPGTHAYNDELRQSAVNWFLEHLAGRKDSFATDRGMLIEDDATLQCTASGQVMAEFDDARSIFDLNADYYREHKCNAAVDPDTARRELESLLNMPHEKGRIYPRFISETVKGAYRYRDVFFFSEENAAVDGVYIEKLDADSGRCTVLLLDEGTVGYEMETDLIRRFLKNGNVLIFDARGVGAAKSRDIRNAPHLQMFGTEYKLNCDAIMMGTSMTALRVYDVLRACDFIRQIDARTKIGLAGKGIGALYALFAGVLNEDIDELYLEDLIPSFESLVMTRHYKYDPRYDLYGVLKKLDIPAILEAFQHKKITRVDTPDIGNHARVRSF